MQRSCENFGKMNVIRIFRIFLWKNALHIRNKLWELLIILSLFLGIFYLYLYTSYKIETTPSFSPDIRDTSTLRLLFPSNDGDLIMYTPSTDTRINTVIEAVRTDLELPVTFVESFDTTETMIFQLEQNCQGNCFAVTFGAWPNKSLNSERLQFTIRSNKMRVSSRKHYVNDEEITIMQDHDEYIRTGFLTLQHLIDKNYIRLISNESNYDLRIAAMPTRSLDVLDSQRVIMFGSLYSVLFNIILLGTFLVPLVEEKQNGVKEFLVIATPLNFLNGVTFFLIRFLVYMAFLVIIVGVATIYRATGIVPITYMLLLMVLFKLSAMTYTYLLSVCFNSVFYAKVGGLLMLIIPYIFQFDSGLISSIASIFFSTKTFMDGIKVFQIFTNKHRNFYFSDLTTNITDWSYSIASIYILLIFQCGLYSILYNYLSCVFPGPGGLKKSYLFFLKPSFFKKRQRNEYTTADRGSDAIIIQDLVKKFKVSKRIINIADQLSMTIKNKQINVLLGHNGVGKTTMLNMIMGSVQKDSGKIVVCSERDVASYRHLIGFCPQHSVFMEYMTCAEHIRFFAELRGMSAKDADSLTKELLKQLILKGQENLYGWQLSGGMKRRLSLGIALAGETKIVILDEPSSGLDIESRRELWDVLLVLRKTKAVLVTTHHMEEAEVLGDKIFILSNGRVQNKGSPLELKRKKGCGYILKICTITEQYKENETLSLIKQYIAEANVVNVVTPTVHISLPYKDKDNYADMLLDLENSLDRLGIESISVTDTSLEDVFLNCATNNDEVDGPQLKFNESTCVPYESLTQPILFSQHIFAIFYKKLIYLRNEWKFTLLMVSLPFFATFLAIILMSSTSSEAENALPLNLNIVKQGQIYLKSAGVQTEFAAKMEKILREEINRYGIEVKTFKEEFGVSLEEEILELQENNLAHFLQNVVGVIDIAKDEILNELKVTVYFSLNIYHSSVVLTNLVDNAILKAQTSENNSIETLYAPVRRYITDVSPSRLDYYAVIIPIGIFFYMFYYASLPFQERENGFKGLQAVPVLRYWCSYFLFDLILHSIVCVILYLLQIGIMPEIFYSKDDLKTISSSIFFYGISYLPILYIFTNSCRSFSTISTYLLSMFIVSAIIPLITSGSVQAMSYYEALITFMRIFPDFNLNHQIRIINENLLLNRKNALSTRSNINNASTELEDLLSTNAMMYYAVFVFFLTGAIFVFIVEDKRICENIRSFLSCQKCRGIHNDISIKGEEEKLVKDEKTKIDKIIEDKEESKYPLLVHNLYKYFDRKPVVYDLNFAVQPEECFGLLGVNGAGKTTTFQMITSNTTISRGTIKINGVDLVTNENQYRYRFGYCPQYDCLNHFMTAYESLKYMAKLRNVKRNKIKNEVFFWLTQMDLIKYSRTQIRHYSGGTKRKLSAAMAMIGSPSLVLLDEPTTGVDPVSRRFLWKCVQKFQERRKTIVLTSHSMDECEQLCNRLAIMAEGRLKCMGSVPELKRKFGSGFTIKMKMNETNCDSLENLSHIETLLNSIFPSSKLRENHAGILTFFIKSEGHISWSKVFQGTEKFIRNAEHLIEDYSINEATLEDIFLKFDTKNLREETPSSSGCVEI